MVGAYSIQASTRRSDPIATGHRRATLENNADDGIEVADSDRNKLTGNTAEANGDAGIALRASTRNLVDLNAISGNADALVDRLDRPQPRSRTPGRPERRRARHPAS